MQVLHLACAPRKDPHGRHAGRTGLAARPSMPAMSSSPGDGNSPVQDCQFAAVIWSHVQVWTGEAPGATPTLPLQWGSLTGGTCSTPICPRTTEEGVAVASTTPFGISGRSATDVSSMELTLRSRLSPLLTSSRGPWLLAGHR